MKEIWPEGWETAGHYVPGMACGGMLHISGQLPVDHANGRMPEGAEAQVRQALANVDAVLQAAGTDRRAVVSCRVYIPDMSLWDEVDRIYKEFFGSHRPARAVVPTRELHYGALVEIEAAAVLEVEK